MIRDGGVYLWYNLASQFLNVWKVFKERIGFSQWTTTIKFMVVY